jgi:hypothetical protein
VAIKILVAGFAIYALRRLIARYRKGGTLTLEFVIWIAVWGGVGVVVFVPQKTDVVARWLGVGSGFNALTFITIVGLLYAVYRLYSRVQTVERDLTRLVRAAALERATHVAVRQPKEPGWTIVPEDEHAA